MWEWVSMAAEGGCGRGLAWVLGAVGGGEARGEAEGCVVCACA